MKRKRIARITPNRLEYTAAQHGAGSGRTGRLGKKTHAITLVDAAKNRVGKVMISSKGGRAKVDMFRHVEDKLGTSSSPFGAKDILGIKRQFLAKHRRSTPSPSPLIQTRHHEKFFTVPLYRRHGMKASPWRAVKVHGREHLAAAQRAKELRHVAIAGAGLAAVGAPSVAWCISAERVRMYRHESCRNDDSDRGLCQPRGNASGGSELWGGAGMDTRRR